MIIFKKIFLNKKIFLMDIYYYINITFLSEVQN